MSLERPRLKIVPAARRDRLVGGEANPTLPAVNTIPCTHWQELTDRYTMLYSVFPGNRRMSLRRTAIVGEVICRKVPPRLLLLVAAVACLAILAGVLAALAFAGGSDFYCDTCTLHPDGVPAVSQAHHPSFDEDTAAPEDPGYTNLLLDGRVLL